MAERTLIEAFRHDVLEAADFVRAIDAASELRDLNGMPSMAWVMRDGFFPNPSSFWPVAIDEVALRQAWFSPETLQLIGETPDEPPSRTISREAAEDTLRRGLRLAVEVVEIFERFLEPLRSGAVQATGLTSAGIMIAIPRAIWQRPATMIDVRLGEVSRHDPETEDDAIEREWTGVSLVARQDAAPQRERSKGGRPSEYDWDRAMLYLMHWIDKNGLPDGKTAATSLVIQIIQGLENKTPDLRHVEREIARRLPALDRYLIDGGKTGFAAFCRALKP